ncbi:MAG: MFS transporter [Clostridiales bacterium]|nr:MFS transporter [Clostridiales bacterium]
MSHTATKKIEYNNAKPWQLVAFAFNNSSTNAQYFMFLLFFMFFCTENLGLNPVVVGLMTTLARVFDGFTDPIIGLLIDKTNTKFGKFRPFIAIGTVIMSISLVSLFWGAQFDSMTARYVWVGVWNVIWVIGYTCSTACTKGAQAILTNNPKQRPLLGGVDAVLTNFLVLLVFSFGFVILNKFGGVVALDSFRKMAMLLVGISVTCATIAIAGIWEKDNEKNYTTDKNAKKVKITDYFSIIKGNKALQMLIVAASTNKIAQTTTSAAVAYFFMIVVGNTDLQAVVTAPAQMVGLAGVAISIFLAVRISKKTSFVIGSWASIAALATAIILRPFSEATLLPFILIMSGIKLTEVVANSNVIPMIADATDYEHWKTGRFAPGMIGTAFSFVDKMISSISGLLVGGVLGLANYTAGMEVTPTLYWAIIGLYFGIALLGHVASVLAMRKYPIDREFYNQMVVDMNEKKNAA